MCDYIFSMIKHPYYYMVSTPLVTSKDSGSTELVPLTVLTTCTKCPGLAEERQDPGIQDPSLKQSKTN